MQHSIVATVAAPTVAIVRNIKADQLDAPTPCTEYTVRQLINHMLFWAPSLEGAARKESVPPPAMSEQNANLTDCDWADNLTAQIDRLVAVWSEPAAWVGTAGMGSPTRLPAPMIGGMVFSELVVHGWDLARATGQEPRWDTDAMETVYQALSTFAEQGRSMGVYGERVPVPDTASPLDRILGLTGRDPQWTA